jgi:hypothetical protein
MLNIFDNMSKIYLAQDRFILSIFLYCYFWKKSYGLQSKHKGRNFLCLELKGMRNFPQTVDENKNAKERNKTCQSFAI